MNEKNNIQSFNSINNSLNTKNKDYDLIIDNSTINIETIKSLQHTIKIKDTVTHAHSSRVAEYSVLIGKKLGLSKDDLNTLKLGALFHDIGKISTPNNILFKNSKLTPEEYSEIKKHPTQGIEILSKQNIPSNIYSIVKYHHERYDGTGYPENLKGEEIPLLTRITTVADSFDAMFSKRPYKENYTIDHIINEIENNKNTQFDPVIADAFLDILKNNYDTIEEIAKKF